MLYCVELEEIEVEFDSIKETKEQEITDFQLKKMTNLESTIFLTEKEKELPTGIDLFDEVPKKN